VVLLKKKFFKTPISLFGVSRLLLARDPMMTHVFGNGGMTRHSLVPSDVPAVSKFQQFPFVSTLGVKRL
jgi:hypothetical protein